MESGQLGNLGRATRPAALIDFGAVRSLQCNPAARRASFRGPATTRFSTPRRLLLIVAIAVAATGAVCNPIKSTDVSRERAIEIARQDIKFTVDSVEAIQTTSEGRVVWRVTIKGRLPDQPPDLFETRIYDIDAQSGEIVSVSTS